MPICQLQLLEHPADRRVTWCGRSAVTDNQNVVYLTLSIIVFSIYNMANAEGFQVEATLATLD